MGFGLGGSLRRTFSVRAVSPIWIEDFKGSFLYLCKADKCFKISMMFILTGFVGFYRFCQADKPLPSDKDLTGTIVPSKGVGFGIWKCGISLLAISVISC